MPKTNDFLMKKLISAVIAHAKALEGTQSSDLYEEFVKIFYSQASYVDLEHRSMSNLVGLAQINWLLLQHRTATEIKVEVFNPNLEDHGWESQHTVIAVLCQDAPFLVDSIRMEINKLNLSPYLVIHMGGMVVNRSAGGDLQSIDFNRKAAMTDPVEAPIYLEIDKQASEEDLKLIVSRIELVVTDVLLAVSDWQAMRSRMQESLLGLSESSAPLKSTDVKESIAFLKWLLDDHFIFLGTRDYTVGRQDKELCLMLTSGSGLGVLSDDTHSKRIHKFSDLPLKAAKLMQSVDRVLMISKTNTLSSVHRSGYTDYIGIKQFNSKGELLGERRFIGLYTSTAYHSSPNAIPFLRKKVTAVLKKSGLREHSHAEKDLVSILSTFPRDDLIQASVNQLYHMSMDILHMQDRRQVKLFVREDNYGRFVSCLVYLPREKFTMELLQQVQSILMEEFEGLESSFATHFSVSVLARIDFLIRVNHKELLKYNIQSIEARLLAASKSWHDQLHELMSERFLEGDINHCVSKYMSAFPASYREKNSPSVAIGDIHQLETLGGEHNLTVEFCDPAESDNELSLKIYNLKSTIPLSDALPIFENLGCRVVDEYPYHLELDDGQYAWINKFTMTYDQKISAESKQYFKEAFLRIWQGEAEDDNFNRLILLANMSWRHVSLLRAYAKYYRQTGTSFTSSYMADTLVANPGITQKLIDFFECKFSPNKQDGSEDLSQVQAQLHQSLDTVMVLDEDRIFRKFISMISATLRTNYYQVDDLGHYKFSISLKFDSKSILNMPLPLPLYDIFVYSRNFEGIHLRADKVARGGIRWSDRRQDFRVEVLGLMKAQQVKNSVIVPSGAKGGFIVKHAPIQATRDELNQLGVACYKGFISGLLDVVDNIENDKVVKHKNTVCYDDDDQYLVVAADKGTATFSDIANEIAVNRGFWLGDAFASGGSTGYDHKKMGITARGAWVSAERHFQDLGLDIKNNTFSVLAIGDMSGDVFGNGMLMSNNILLNFAFNHQHIFIDPAPDGKKSYNERKRLFQLPRSTWADYDSALISKGGGVFARKEKLIKLSAQVRKLLQIEETQMEPDELIRALLCAKVDMIWNGGIGTFIKSSEETDLMVGDHASDSIRVNANRVRAKIICEGGNLGLTQLARIEYERSGGRVNTDFIDNSAGVDCSDHEVNIKILLNDVMADSKLSMKDRNLLLQKMGDDVAQLVLKNNYSQNQTISFISYFNDRVVASFASYIDALTERGSLDPKLEYLPTSEELLARTGADYGLTRPEISVLLAYSKIVLAKELLDFDIVGDPMFVNFIQYAFPERLRTKYRDYLHEHRLRREIIATQLSHRVVSGMGITFVHQMQLELDASPVDVVKAYVAAFEIFNMEEMDENVRSLDFKIPAEDQNQIALAVFHLLRHSVRWLLCNKSSVGNISDLIEQYKGAVAELTASIPSIILGHHDEEGDFAVRVKQLKDSGVSSAVIKKLTLPLYLSHALNIAEAAKDAECEINHAAVVYFKLIDHFNLGDLRQIVIKFSGDGEWVRLALSGLHFDLDKIQQLVTSSVLRSLSKNLSQSAVLEDWIVTRQAELTPWTTMWNNFERLPDKDLASVSVIIRRLLKFSIDQYSKVEGKKTLLS